MAQYTWTLQHGDTLPHIAEQCGHSGEWTVILETSPWLEGLDYLAIPPGSDILLPEGWAPPGADPDRDQEYAARESHTRHRTSSKDDEK